MASPPKILSDGYTDFSGGMDSSRGPSVIGKNQYVWSTNSILNKHRTGLDCRPGKRPVEFQFNSDYEKNTYKKGKIQGCGYYQNGQEIIILLSVSGYIFQAREIGRYKYQIGILNYGRQNNPDNIDCFITGVKNAAVVNDGESAPFKAELDTIDRVIGNYAIKAGYSGAYVQNRFFYIDITRENIIASTIRNPFDLTEAYDANILGFTAPEDNDFITAIGRLTTLRSDVSGGNLAFSNLNNTYSVDVRGPRTGWGTLAGQGVGHVANAIPDIGAISPYSFTSFNSNLYFRSQGLGMVSLKRSQSEFQNIDAYAAQSIEASRFFDNDSEIFLNQCRTAGFKGRLYTTVNPFQNGNQVLWKGLIVYAPAVYSSSQEGVLPSYYESVYTGLDVHSLLSIKYPDDSQDMFINAVHEGENVMYVLDDSIDYDILPSGKTQEIERKILTRAFDFSNPFVVKRGHSQSYALSQLKRDTKIEIYTRPLDTGKFIKQWDATHKVGTTIKNGVFKPSLIKDEQRQFVPVSADPEIQDECSTSSKSYFMRQDLIKILGSANLKRWVRSVEIDTPQTVASSIETKGTPYKYEEEKVFTYKL